MWLVTNVKNLPAVHFYKRIGYKIVKEAENYYGDGETRYILEKKIKS
jgi:ribosomal protein S18 acetylase RimI-like enzyme